jgi:phosphoenolpyruvate carboxylase
MLLRLTGYTELMEDQPAGKHSIEMREAIVQPLLTIQQYALSSIHELKESKDLNEDQLEIYEKLVTRSLFGNINASRNSC